MVRILLLAACVGLARAYMGPAPAGAPAGKAALKHPFNLPPLPYAYNALEPNIDEATMKYHHDNHFNTYITNLNTALSEPQNSKYTSLNLDEMLGAVNKSLPEGPFATTVRNNGGGIANHLFFFENLAPTGSNKTGMPRGALAAKIDETYGNFTSFKKQFTTAATSRFGSGFAWLVLSDMKLKIVSTANQDNPLMYYLSGGATGIPLVALDVWEHAYYLKYQYRRPAYIESWWNVVNWEMAEGNYQAAMMGKSSLYGSA